MMHTYQRESGLESLANCAPDMSSCACQSAPQKATVSERMLMLKEMAAEAESRAKDLADFLFGDGEKKEAAQPTWEPASMDETVDWIVEKMKDTLRMMQEMRERL